MRYGVICCDVWDKAEFRALSHVGMLSLMFLWTFQKRNSAGIYRESAESLGILSPIGTQDFVKGIREAAQAGFVHEDRNHCVIMCHNNARHCPPSNPNILKSWRSYLSVIPRISPLYAEWCRQTYDAIRDKYGAQFLSMFGNEWAQKIETTVHPQEAPTSLFPDEPVPPEEKKKRRKTTPEEYIERVRLNPAMSHVDVDYELSKMDLWLDAHPGREKTIQFMARWFGRITKPAGRSQPRARTVTPQTEANLATAQASKEDFERERKGEMR